MEKQLYEEEKKKKKKRETQRETDRASQYVLVLLSSCLQMENKPVTTE